MEEKGNVYEVSLATLKERDHGSILKWILRNEMYSVGSGQGPVVATSEHTIL
jgi:hypothetical protein